MEMDISITAILVAVVAQFIFGFVWYTPLFGKTWAIEMGMDPDAKPESSKMVKMMVLMILGNFLFAWVFAHNMAAWDFVPGMEEAGKINNTISAAIFTYLGFFLPQDLGIISWEQKSTKLFLINTSYHLIAVIIVAFILAYL